MGHNVSVVNGVRSENFYEQRNAIHEIWVDDAELISRLPFGDSDLGQSNWVGKWPKIPWHQFIIPLKRDISSNITMDTNITAPALDAAGLGNHSQYIRFNAYARLLDRLEQDSAFWYYLFILMFAYFWRKISQISLWNPESVCEMLESQHRSQGIPCRAEPSRKLNPWFIGWILGNIILISLAIILAAYGISGMAGVLNGLDAGASCLVLGCISLLAFIMDSTTNITSTWLAMRSKVKQLRSHASSQPKTQVVLPVEGISIGVSPSHYEKVKQLQLHVSSQPYTEVVIPVEEIAIVVSSNNCQGV